VSIEKALKEIDIEKALKEIDKAKTNICNIIKDANRDSEKDEIKVGQIWKLKRDYTFSPSYVVVLHLHTRRYPYYREDENLVMFNGYFRNNNIPKRMNLPKKLFLERYKYLPHKKLAFIDNEIKRTKMQRLAA